MIWRICFPVLCAGLLSSCVTEGSFTKKLSAALCKQVKECDRGYFDGEWDSVADCKDEYSDYMEDYEEWLEENNCDYDSSQAKECIKAIRSASCEEFDDGEFYRDCNDVWTCEPSGGGHGGRG